jgi:hypothetical protein
MVFPTANVTQGSGLTINTLPNAGQANMANSLPCAIASDQSAVPVTALSSGAITNPTSVLTRSANVTTSPVTVVTSGAPYFTWTAANPPLNGQGLIPTATIGNFTGGTTYWVRDAAGSSFNLSASLGAAAIVPTTAGTVTMNLQYKPNDLIAASAAMPAVPFFSIAGGAIIPRVRLQTNNPAARVPFVTAQTLGSPVRNDFSGQVGFQFTVGPSPITVTALGRWVISGNNQAHTLSIVRAADLAPMGSVSVPTSGATPGAYAYGTVTPFTLAASTSYYMMTTEVIGGDNWYGDTGSTMTTTGAAIINNSEYSSDSVTYNVGVAASYGPVNFKYQSTPANTMFSINLWSVAPTYTSGDAQLYAPATGSAGLLANFLVTMIQFGDGAAGFGQLTGANQMALKLASGTSVFWDLQILSYMQPFASQVFTLTAECLN